MAKLTRFPTPPTAQSLKEENGKKRGKRRGRPTQKLKQLVNHWTTPPHSSVKTMVRSPPPFNSTGMFINSWNMTTAGAKLERISTVQEPMRPVVISLDVPRFSFSDKLPITHLAFRLLQRQKWKKVDSVRRANAAVFSLGGRWLCCRVKKSSSLPEIITLRAVSEF